MLFDLFSGEGLSINTVITFGIRIFIILFFLPLHEFAHGYVAYKLGDHTAKNMGRLTLNPLAHIDVFGLILSLLVGFGFAKAVPVNIRNFRPEKRKRNMALVALAGPLSNILLAIVFILINRVIFVSVHDSTLLVNIANICYFAATYNISLAVFNLLPVPPLDGSRILNVVLPDRTYYKIMQYEKQIGLVFFVLILTGTLNGVIEFFSTLLINLLYRAISLPFGLI